MPKRILQGTVVSTANDKTITVRVERSFQHPVLKKTVRRTKRYSAHDPENKYAVGDLVRIEECRPLSKTKKWIALESVTAGQSAGQETTGQEAAGPETAG